MVWKVKFLRNECLKLLSEVKSLSHVRLFATPWTVSYQVPPSIGFSRQEYWRGLPFPSLGDLPDLGIEPGLLHCRQTLYHLSRQTLKKNLKWLGQASEENSFFSFFLCYLRHFPVALLFCWS